MVRISGKHVFNPTNVALVVMLLLTDRVWVSPGQWGSLAFFAFLMACLGGLVVKRAARADVTLAFLVRLRRAAGRPLAWLGEPLAIPLHRLESGALLLFAFFMISDPKTTPDSRAGRLLFAALVAAGAWYVQFRLFRTNGLLWSLALCSFARSVSTRFACCRVVASRLRARPDSLARAAGWPMDPCTDLEGLPTMRRFLFLILLAALSVGLR